MDQHKLLLLVQDEPTAAKEIGTALERLGYLVKVATTEQTGLRAAHGMDAAL
jgi:DNA-binding response OmpR family regulator